MVDAFVMATLSLVLGVALLYWSRRCAAVDFSDPAILQKLLIARSAKWGSYASFALVVVNLLKAFVECCVP